MFKLDLKCVPALLVSLGWIIACSTTSPGAVITLSVVNQQISTTSNFTAGTTFALPAGKGPFDGFLTLEGYPLPGQYYRFGVAARVTGNPNPEFGSAWDTAAQAAYGTPAMPANLGLSSLGIRILNTDTAGTSLAPLSNGGKTRAVFNNNNVFIGGLSDRGDVSGGIAGSPSSIFHGMNPNGDVQNPSFVPTLAQFTTQTDFVLTLPYIRGSGLEFSQLFLQVVLSDTSLLTEVQPGQTDAGGQIVSDAVFGARSLTANDTIVVVVPEPTAVTWLLALITIAKLRLRSSGGLR